MLIVSITRTADKQLKNLDEIQRRRIVTKIISLNSQPVPSGVQKLKGKYLTYRIRVGSYRIIYTYQSSFKTLTVLRIAHRSKVYKEK